MNPRLSRLDKEIKLLQTDNGFLKVCYITHKGIRKKFDKKIINFFNKFGYKSEASSYSPLTKLRKLWFDKDWNKDEKESG